MNPTAEFWFPNVPPKTLELEARVRHTLRRFPERVRFFAYMLLTHLHSDLVSTEFRSDDGFVVVRQCGHEIQFPSPLPLIKFQHISCGYEKWLQRKYTLPGFVQVEPDDIVIDCGGYVGGFALSAAKVAKEVHVFEPAPMNFRCIQKNCIKYTNVKTNKGGLYNCTKKMTLNISSSSVEHSLLAPDHGEVLDRTEIQVRSIFDYCADNNLRELDFVKIEAEGVEPEVFDGLGEIRPRKFAIDVSPERNEKSPVDELMPRLSKLGYESRKRGNVLFARLPGSSVS